MFVKTIRHHMSKSTVVKKPLAWLQHRAISYRDVFVASYPRSGSTWFRFMLYELITGQESSFAAVDQTIAGVGRHFRAPEILPAGGRVLQTHEPYRSQYHHAIYLVRDVRDVVISEYNFARRLRFFDGDFDTFFEQFMNGRANRYGFWGDQVQSWYAAYTNRKADIMWVRFEDMRKDPHETLRRALAFLNIERDEEQIARVVENHTLAQMKEKENRSPKFARNAHGIRFVTDGSIGKWEGSLSDLQVRRLEAEVGDLLEKLGYEPCQANRL